MKTNYLRQTSNGHQDGGGTSLNTQLFVKYAQKAGWEVTRIPDFSGSILKKNGKKHLLYEQTILTDYPAARTADNKIATKRFLQAAGLPTPEGYVVKKNDPNNLQASVFESLKKPVVVKPAQGTFGGYKVYTEIETSADYQSALQCIFEDPLSKIASKALVEEQVPTASDYRLFCTTEKCLGVIHRIPANVIGDGNSTIENLVALKNKDRIHQPLKLDDISLMFLKSKTMTPDTIPTEGQQVFLRRAANTCAGGDCHHITPEVHQSLKDLAIKAVQSIPGLLYSGVDILTTNGSQDQGNLTPQIIELNHSPDLAAFYHPDNDKPFDIVGKLLNELFPSNKSSD